MAECAFVECSRGWGCRFCKGKGGIRSGNGRRKKYKPINLMHLFCSLSTLTASGDSQLGSERSKGIHLIGSMGCFEKKVKRPQNDSLDLPCTLPSSTACIPSSCLIRQKDEASLLPPYPVAFHDESCKGESKIVRGSICKRPSKLSVM